jgi:thymidylate kinase
MIIIFEGLDNTGKSTQIEQIRKMLDKRFHLMHYSAVRGRSSEECLEYSKVLYKEGFQLMKKIPEANILGSYMVQK